MVYMRGQGRKAAAAAGDAYKRYLTYVTVACHV